ncbi:alpha/beta-hydrolase [Armillaria fumosa]|nr:alpha/beta-hydrolase [Armillaria fumosa]
MSGQFVTSQDGKPSVVFVHGFLTSSLNWTRQFSDRQLLESLLNMSDQPESEDAYVSARHAEDFQAICTAFAVAKTVVVGWSLGGIIVPDILSRFGTSPLPNALQELVGAFFSPGYIAKVSSEERCAWIGSAATMNTAARTFSISRTQDETALLSVAKELPILCIQATGDKPMKHDKHAAFMKKHFGDNLDYRKIPGGGHASFYEFPGTVNSMIIEFVLRVCDTDVDTVL